MKDCIFCKIVAGKIPANIVLESRDFLAFHDINPIAPVHILIITKTHIRDFNEVSPEMMAGLTSFAQNVAKILGVENSGYRLITNVGDNGGQEVPHLHFHLIGGAKLKWHHLTDTNPRNSL